MSDAERTRAQLVAELEALRDQLGSVSAECEALRRSEARLREIEARDRVLCESTHDFVAELDAEGRVLFVSPSCEAILGLKPEEMIGTTPFSLLHTDDVERLAESFLRRVELRRPAGGGSLFRVRHRDGSWRWLQGGGVSYSTESGSRVVCVCRDVTRQILAEAERRRLEEWMHQARRFESLGVLAGGIAHDFNNLLTPILGEASLAVLDLPEHAAVRVRLERIRLAAQRAAALTGEMLHYAGMGALDRRFVDLSELAGGMQEMLESATGGRARLRLEIAAALPPVEGDPNRLAHALGNLVANAAEASPEGGEVVVRTGAVELDRAALSRCFLGHDLPEGCYVSLEVVDAGAGMDAEARARLFDPFFSTKFTGRGLGLAAVLGIVRSHRGAIEVESAEGRGTRVALLLPARAGEPRMPRPDDPDPHTGARVLVVEDDLAVRELAGETLRRAGFVPVCVAEGADALAWLRDEAAGIRAVVLDWTLRGATSAELLDALRRVRPDVPVLLVSGHPAEATARALGARTTDAFLQKPFLPGDLVQRLREALGNRVS